jgi:hypothetical protein
MKSEFTIREISLNDAQQFIAKFHYLADIYGKFLLGIRHKFYGLYRADELVGAVQYTAYDNWERQALANHFGFIANQNLGHWEICRLAVAPIKEYNITSWFLSRTMKLLCESEIVEGIITVADARMHNGCIYAACNFDYYGLMKGRVSGMKDCHFHVFLKTYNGNQCVWQKQPFEKDYEITL